MNWPEDFINKIICGDSLSVMKQMPSESIDMAITSPPYWGLRDYGFKQIFGGNPDCKHKWNLSLIEHDNLRYRGHNANVGSNKNPEIHKGKEKSGGQFCSCGAWKGQLGLEPTPELYIEHLTEIFNEAKRVLKKEGTLWLNIGDTYATTSGRQGKGDLYGKQPKFSKDADNSMPIQYKIDLPQKCLCMIPERLAWELIQNGWILRNKIIWYKPNCMPSSVKDRFNNRWEYLFLFSKNRKYYFDLDAVREPHKTMQSAKKEKTRGLKNGSPNINSQQFHSANIEYFPAGKNPGDVIKTPSETRRLGAILGTGKGVKVPGGKGWTGHPPGGEHKIKHDPRWCSPEGKNPGDFFKINTQPFPEAHFAVFPEKLCEKPIKAGCPEDGIVLDPFAGAGTALFVAKQLRRRFIGIDIKQEYCDMCEKRLAQGVL